MKILKILKEEKGSLGTFTALGFISIVICIFIAIALVVCSVMIKAHTVNGWLHTSMKHAVQASQVVAQVIWCPVEEEVIVIHEVCYERADHAFKRAFTGMTLRYIDGQVQIEFFELKEASPYIEKPGFKAKVIVPIWSGYLPFMGRLEFNIPMSYFAVIGEY